MNLLLIIGPHAVGKMTIARALCKMAGMRMMHNHSFRDELDPLFGPDTAASWELLNDIRMKVFSHFANEPGPGFVFTFMWAFDRQSNWDYVNSISNIFQERGNQIMVVELEAPMEIRLMRNMLPDRKSAKPSKGDDEITRVKMIEVEQLRRMNSLPGEIPFQHYLRLDTSKMSAQEAASRIFAYWKGCNLDKA